MECDQKHNEFLVLYSKSQRRMYTYIRSQVLSAHDADDIFQEVSTILWRRFDEYRPDTDFSHWACALARVEVLAHHRHRKRLMSILREDVADAVGQRVLELSESVEARAAALADCLETLTPLSREMLRRRYHAGKTVPEIAARDDRSESALYKAFQKIHDALFQCIESKLARRSAP